MPRLIFPLFLLLGGCVSLDDVIGGIANTPDWFQERRVEIRGEGYPDINRVPILTDNESVQANIQKTEALARSDLLAFNSDPRNAVSTVSEADMSELSVRLRTAIPAQIAQIDAFLTDAELAELRRKVSPPAIKNPK